MHYTLMSIIHELFKKKKSCMLLHEQRCVDGLHLSLALKTSLWACSELVSCRDFSPCLLPTGLSFEDMTSAALHTL
jgi:hypothetical protein